MAKKSFFKQSASVAANSTTTLLEVSKPSKFLKNTPKSNVPLSKTVAWKKWFIAGGLTVGALLIMVLAVMVWWYVSRFERASGASVSELVTAFWQGRQTDALAGKDRLTVLLLGLDQSENQRETSQLTDTIILATYTKSANKLWLYSLPRDLWIDSLKTKINALYYYGQQSGGGNGGITLLSSVVTEITGLNVDHHIIITMDLVKEIVDAVGGVEVAVERSFEDYQYPREIDISSKDPSVLYQTVTFTAGTEVMNGTRALQYIRSRHSQDEFEGSDEGRERRQQRLLSALKTTLLQTNTLTNPTVMGNLYRVWKESVVTSLDEVTLMAVLGAIVPAEPTISSLALPIQDATHKGVIYHPNRGPVNQWVYLPVDPSWNEIRKWFSQ